MKDLPDNYNLGPAQIRFSSLNINKKKWWQDKNKWMIILGHQASALCLYYCWWIKDLPFFPDVLIIWVSLFLTWFGGRHER